MPNFAAVVPEFKGLQIQDPVDRYTKQLGVSNALLTHQTAQQAQQEQNALRDFMKTADLKSPETRNKLMGYGKSGMEMAKGLDDRRKAELDQEKQIRELMKQTAMQIMARPDLAEQFLLKHDQDTGDDTSEERAEFAQLDAEGRRQMAMGWVADLKDMQPDFETFDTGGSRVRQGFDKRTGAPVGEAQTYDKTADPNRPMASGSDGYHPPIPTSSGYLMYDQATRGYVPVLSGGKPALPVSADAPVQGAVATYKASGTAQGKAQGEAAVALPSALQKADYGISVIDKLLVAPGRETMTGLSGTVDPRNYTPGTQARDARALADQIKGQAFLEAFESLKGGGQITETEGIKATQAMARLDTAQTDEAYEAALKELRGILQVGKSRAQKKAAASPAPAAGGVIDWNDLP